MIHFVQRTTQFVCMLRKPDPNLGTGWRAGARRLKCDFNGPRTGRAKSVKISNAGTVQSHPGRSLPHLMQSRSLGVQKESVRWYQFEALRGGFTLRRACNPERWFGSAASPMRGLMGKRDLSPRLYVVACVVGFVSFLFDRWADFR
jgi:hypothetical protein